MRIIALIQRWGLLRIFALSGFVAIVSISIVSGYFYFSFLRENLLAREMAVSSEFIQSASLINNPEAYFEGSMKIEDKTAVEEFFNHVIGIPDVFRAAVFDADFQIIWSNDNKIIGKRFADNDELRIAYRGESVFNWGVTDEHAKQEHVFLPDDVKQFVESYIPVWDENHERVIGVVELYKSPRALFDALARGELLVATVSLFGGLILYLLLFWVVRTAHQLIEMQRIRIKQASNRGVELNEQYLRRIGSELHDGPIQSIGFALLKLDFISQAGSDAAQSDRDDFDVVDKIRHALDDALQELRSLSAGLTIPELRNLSAREAIMKVIKRHESRTSTSVSHELHHLPGNLGTPTKICLYRLVQEGLNNAYRHGAGIDQRVEVSMQGARVTLTISDGGPGMDVHDVSKINDADHLGLRGMRERVESLGGEFRITRSAGSKGVKLIATLPVDD